MSDTSLSPVPPESSPSVPPRALFFLWVSAGVPGAVSVYSESGVSFDESAPSATRFTRLFGGGITTPLGYGCYTSSTRTSGVEFGVSAPYVAYGRKHPVLGDRLQVFIPMLGSVQCTSTGCFGVSFSIPLMSPFLRIGLSCFLRNERTAPLFSRLLARTASWAERVSGAVRGVPDEMRQLWRQTASSAGAP